MAAKKKKTAGRNAKTRAKKSAPPATPNSVAGGTSTRSNRRSATAKAGKATRRSSGARKAVGTGNGRASRRAIQIEPLDVPSVAGKSLVIVESPAKARTIGKYLGPDYRVRATVGHVRDLP